MDVASALAAPEHRPELAVSRCKTIDVDVPIGSEIVIEGVVSTDLEPEGPFGDWTGCYARPQMKPTFHVTQISHRRDALYQTILPGTSKEQILLTVIRSMPQIEAIKASYPEVVRVAVPEYGLGRLVIVAVDKTERAAEIIDRYLELQKINRVVVVNADVDVDSAKDVMWAVSNRLLEPEKVFVRGCKDEWWNNLKLGIDTTVDLTDIRHVRPRIVRVPVAAGSGALHAGAS